MKLAIGQGGLVGLSFLVLVWSACSSSGGSAGQDPASAAGEGGCGAHCEPAGESAGDGGGGVGVGGTSMSASAPSHGGGEGGESPVAGGEGGAAGQAGAAPVDVCAGAEDGSPCGGRLDICIDQACAASYCGDGYIDVLTGELCDDANDVTDDGCEPGCEPSCTPEADDCDDGDPCNGTESCGESSTCETTAPPDCDDDNPCTADSCDPVLLCQQQLIDGDGDGQAATTLGACGTDCNDDNPAVHVGAADPCDGIDNDCDQVLDEGGAVTWWQDCDKDGYALLDAPTRQSCAKPTDATTCVGGTWTSIDPNENDDCNDTKAAIRPGVNETIGDGVDQNCNGSETCFVDADNDGYRLATSLISNDTDCNDPGEALQTDKTNDCDDTKAAINPGVSELPGDQIDQNCDTDELCYVDADDDTYRTSATKLSGDLDCTDSGEARSSDSLGDCNDNNENVHGTEPPTSGDNEENNSQWFAPTTNQSGGPNLQLSVVSPPGVLTLHAGDTVDHYTWDQAYASWSPGYQPFWICRVSGLAAGQSVNVRVGAFVPAGGTWQPTLCSSPSNMSCFSISRACNGLEDGEVCSTTSKIANPSAGAAAYGFGVSVTKGTGWDTCDVDYDVECKLKTTPGW